MAYYRDILAVQNFPESKSIKKGIFTIFDSF